MRNISDLFSKAWWTNSPILPIRRYQKRKKVVQNSYLQYKSILKFRNRFLQAVYDLMTLFCDFLLSNVYSGGIARL